MQDQYKIYCVEDDESIRELVVYTLGSTGFEAEGFETAAAFYEAVKKQRPSLVLLDIMLPGEDGISILKKLRSESETAHIPVIMVTAKETEYQKVQALDLGADDYITKPFGMMELVSRIRAVLRRMGPGPNDAQTIRVGAVEMNLEKHSVAADGQPVTLTLKEYELLRHFMQNPGTVMGRDQLLLEIWGYDFSGESRTLDVHVRTLRQKLGRPGSQIETVRGVGYKIEG